MTGAEAAVNSAGTTRLPPLLEDAEIRIDLLPHGAGRSDTLVVTFDPLAYLADKPPFGNDFLRKQGVDVVAVRKKTDNFYQPLSREAFEATLRPLLGRYRRVVAYGSSLGAYAALYYCRDLDCTVVASSPRVSAHPGFGEPVWQSRVAFRHQLFDPRHRARCQAHILYDPKDRIDRRFVETHLLPQFPDAAALRLPYSGHPSNHFLAEIGFIAPFVRAVIAGQPLPQPDRRRKSASVSYLVGLAQACAQRGKPRWATALVDRALVINPRHPEALRTRGRNAMLRHDWTGAQAAFEAALERTPGDHLSRHWLGLTLKALQPPASFRPPAAPLPAAPAGRLDGLPGPVQRALRWLRRRWTLR